MSVKPFATIARPRLAPFHRLQNGVIHFGIGRRTLRLGTVALPAYGSIEIRPMSHAWAPNVRAVRSYSAYTCAERPQRAVTMRPSTDGTIWQMTYGRFDGFMGNPRLLRLRSSQVMPVLSLIAFTIFGSR